MTNESLFVIASNSVLPGWLLLIFLPRWKWTTRLITSVLLPGLLGLLYPWLAIRHLLEMYGAWCRKIFYTLDEARVLIERCRREYNQVQPHSSLRYRPPAPEAIE